MNKFGASMLNKEFVERLGKELDSIGVPVLNSERIEIVAKLLKIPKFKAESLINGVIMDELIIRKIAGELEVNPEWLLGRSNKRAWRRKNAN